MKTVQYLAGHATPDITLAIYSHLTYNRPEDLIAKVTNAFSSPPSALWYIECTTSVPGGQMRIIKDFLKKQQYLKKDTAVLYTHLYTETLSYTQIYTQNIVFFCFKFLQIHSN